MNPNIRQLLFGVVFFIAGVSLGWVVGTVKTYKETAGIVAEAEFKQAAADLEMHIALLQALHADDYRTVSDRLEEMVDGDLVALAHYPASILPSEDKIIQTIVKAKQYRDRYPVAGRSAEVSTAIDKAFEKAGAREGQ